MIQFDENGVPHVIPTSQPTGGGLPSSPPSIPVNGPSNIGVRPTTLGDASETNPGDELQNILGNYNPGTDPIFHQPQQPQQPQALTQDPTHGLMVTGPSRPVADPPHEDTSFGSRLNQQQLLQSQRGDQNNWWNRFNDYVGKFVGGLPGGGGESGGLAAVHSFEEAIPGTIGAFAGGRLGMGAGALVPIGGETGVTEAIGGLVGAQLGGMGGDAVMQWGLHTFMSPDQLQQYQAMRAAEEDKYPMQSDIAQLLPMAAVMRPSPAMLSKAAWASGKVVTGSFSELRTPAGRVAAQALFNTAFGAGTQAAITAGNEWFQNGNINPLHIATSAVAGSLMNKPTALGKLMGFPDGHPASEFAKDVNARQEDGATTLKGSINESLQTKADLGTKVTENALQEPSVRSAYDALNGLGDVHVVGGAIRDAVLDPSHSPNDYDLTFGGDETQLKHGLDQAVAEAQAQGLQATVQKTGENFPVYRLKIGDSETEIALHRTENPKNANEYQAAPNTPIQEDLKRRDFLHNSMAVNLNSRELVDPHNGYEALRGRSLQTVQPEAFKGDPARLLRALGDISRFGLTPHSETLNQMRQAVPLLDGVAKERFAKELLKMASGDHFADALRVAEQTGLLDKLSPKLRTMVGFDQKSPYHNQSLWEHTLGVVDHVSQLNKDPMVRLAALFHDIGKPDSQWFDDKGVAHYYGNEAQGKRAHEDIGASVARETLGSMHLSSEQIDQVAHLVQHHQFPSFEDVGGAQKFLKTRIEPGLEHIPTEKASTLRRLRINHLFDLREADQENHTNANDGNVKGMKDAINTAVERQVPTRRRDLVINGTDLENAGIVKPGPEMGKILNDLTEAITKMPEEGGVPNNRDTLLNLARSMVGQEQKVVGPEATGHHGLPLPQGWRVVYEEPDSIHRIAQQRGLASDMAGETKAFSDHNKREIILPAGIDPAEQRHLAAHEIAHVLFRQDPNAPKEGADILAKAQANDPSVSDFTKEHLAKYLDHPTMTPEKLAEEAYAAEKGYQLENGGSQQGSQQQTFTYPAAQNLNQGLHQIESEPSVVTVRHGRTALNLNGDIRGDVDVPLDEVGQEQAQILREAFKGVKVAAIYSSDLSRAHDTALAIANATGVPVQAMPDLRPWKLGKFEGRPTIKALPTIKKSVLKNPDVPVEGGESFNQFKGRVLPVVNGAFAQAEKVKGIVVIVGHDRIDRTTRADIATGQVDHEVDNKIFLDHHETPPGGVSIFTKRGGNWNYDPEYQNSIELNRLRPLGEENNAIEEARRKTGQISEASGTSEANSEQGQASQGDQASAPSLTGTASVTGPTGTPERANGTAGDGTPAGATTTDAGTARSGTGTEPGDVNGGNDETANAAVTNGTATAATGATGNGADAVTAGGASSFERTSDATSQAGTTGGTPSSTTGSGRTPLDWKQRYNFDVSGSYAGHEELVDQVLSHLDQSGLNRAGLVTKLQLHDGLIGGKAIASWRPREPDAIHISTDIVRPEAAAVEAQRLLESLREVDQKSPVAAELRANVNSIADGLMNDPYAFARAAVTHEMIHALTPELIGQKTNQLGESVYRMVRAIPQLWDAASQAGLGNEVFVARDWADGYDIYLKSIGVDPSSSEAHTYYGNYAEQVKLQPGEVENLKASQVALMEHLAYSANDDLHPYSLASDQAYEQSVNNPAARELNRQSAKAWLSQAVEAHAEAVSGSAGVLPKLSNSDIRAAAAAGPGNAAAANQVGLSSYYQPELFRKVLDPTPEGGEGVRSKTKRLLGATAELSGETRAVALAKGYGKPLPELQQALRDAAAGVGDALNEVKAWHADFRGAIQGSLDETVRQVKAGDPVPQSPTGLTTEQLLNETPTPKRAAKAVPGPSQEPTGAPPAGPRRIARTRTQEGRYQVSKYGSRGYGVEDTSKPVSGKPSDNVVSWHKTATDAANARDALNVQPAQVSVPDQLAKLEADHQAYVQRIKQGVHGAHPEDVSAALKGANMKYYFARKKLRDQLPAAAPEPSPEQFEKLQAAQLPPVIRTGHEIEKAMEVPTDTVPTPMSEIAATVAMNDHANLTDEQVTSLKQAEEEDAQKWAVDHAVVASGHDPFELNETETPKEALADITAGGGEAPPPGGPTPPGGTPPPSEPSEPRPTLYSTGYQPAYFEARKQGGSVAEFANQTDGAVSAMHRNLTPWTNTKHPIRWFKDYVNSIREVGMRYERAGKALDQAVKDLAVKAGIDYDAMNEMIRKPIEMAQGPRQAELAKLQNTSPEAAALSNYLHEYWTTTGDQLRSGPAALFRYAYADYLPHLITGNSNGGSVRGIGGQLSPGTKHAIERASDDYVMPDGTIKKVALNKTIEDLEAKGYTVEHNLSKIFQAHGQGVSRAARMRDLIHQFQQQRFALGDRDVPSIIPTSEKTITKMLNGQPAPWTVHDINHYDPKIRDQFRTVKIGSGQYAFDEYHVWKPLAEHIERLSRIEEGMGTAGKGAKYINDLNNVWKAYKFSINPVHIYNLVSNISTHSGINPLGFIGTIQRGREAFKDIDRIGDAVRHGYTPNSEMAESADLGPVGNFFAKAPVFKQLHNLMWNTIAYKGGLGLYERLTDQLTQSFEQKEGRSPDAGETEALKRMAAEHAKRAVGFVDDLDMTKDWRLYGGALALANKWTTSQIRSAGGALGIKYIKNIGGGESYNLDTSTMNKLDQRMHQQLVFGGIARLLASSMIMAYAGSYLLTGQPFTPFDNYQKDPLHTFDVYGGRDPQTNRDIWVHNPLYGYTREMADYVMAGVKAYQQGKNPLIEGSLARMTGKLNPITKTSYEVINGREIGRWMQGYGDNADIDSDKSIQAIHKSLDNLGVPDYGSLENRMIYAFRQIAPTVGGFPTNPSQPVEGGQLASALGVGTLGNAQNWALGLGGTRIDMGTQYVTDPKTGGDVPAADYYGALTAKKEAKDALTSQMILAAQSGDYATMDKLRQQLGMSASQATNAVLYGISHSSSGSAQGLLYQGAAEATTDPNLLKTTTLGGHNLTQDQASYYQDYRFKNEATVIDFLKDQPNFKAGTSSDRQQIMNDYIKLADKITNENMLRALGYKAGAPVTSMMQIIGETTSLRQMVGNALTQTDLYQMGITPEDQQAMQKYYASASDNAVWNKYFGKNKGQSIDAMAQVLTTEANVEAGTRMLVNQIPDYQAQTDPMMQETMMGGYVKYAHNLIVAAMEGKTNKELQRQIQVGEVMPLVKNSIILEVGAKEMLHQSPIYINADPLTQKSLDTKYADLAHKIALHDTTSAVDLKLGDETQLYKLGFAQALRSRLMADEGYQQLTDRFGGQQVVTGHQQELAAIKARFHEETNLPPSKLAHYDKLISEWYYHQHPDYGEFIKTRSNWEKYSAMGQLYNALSKDELNFSANSPLATYAPNLTLDTDQTQVETDPTQAGTEEQGTDLNA